MNNSLLDRYQAVLFDLDGTLLDSLDDLADAMNEALGQLGFPPHPSSAYRYFVGDGVEELAARALPEGHRDQTTIIQCFQRMRAIYRHRWNVKTRPYPGIPELLNGLTERGLKLTILSNKPDEFTRAMVEYYFASWPFSLVAGQKEEVPRKPDPAGALAIAEHLGIAPERFLYLGDTNTDMKTARAAGMFPVGVLWGFRGAEELRANGAEILIESPLDLLKTGPFSAEEKKG